MNIGTTYGNHGFCSFRSQSATNQSNPWDNYRTCTTDFGQTFLLDLDDSQLTYTYHYTKFPSYMVFIVSNLITCLDLFFFCLLTCLHLYCRYRASKMMKPGTQDEKPIQCKKVALAFNPAASWGLRGAEAFDPCLDQEMNAAVDEMNRVAKRYRFSKIPFLLLAFATPLVMISVLSAVGGYWTNEGFKGLMYGILFLQFCKYYAGLGAAQKTYDALYRKARHLTRHSPSLEIVVDVSPTWFYNQIIFFTCVTYLPIRLIIRRKRVKDSSQILPDKAQAGHSETSIMSNQAETSPV